ncbi:MAG: 50S ribosomal protein L13 [Planctomycetota bacterium]
MKELIEKTPVLTKEEAREKRRWFLLDAENQCLGRFASRVVKLLTGKFSPQYTPHADMGACVVIINAEKIKLTGEKINTKVYEKYSGYPGGLKQKSIKDFLSKKPEMILKLAISRMLPKNKLRKRMIRRLHIYKGSDHPHTAQKPLKIEAW